jgi:hypothetical protein
MNPNILNAFLITVLIFNENDMLLSIITPRSLIELARDIVRLSIL